MDILLLSLALVLSIVAVVGCVMPVVPGPVVAFVAILLAQWSDMIDFSASYLWIIAGIAAAVTAADYILPALITKKFGGTKYAARGSLIGMIVGMFIPPIGIIIGLVVGAFVGEMIFAKRSGGESLVATIGAFLGFLAGTGIKLIFCVYVLYTITVELFYYLCSVI